MGEVEDMMVAVYDHEEEMIGYKFTAYEVDLDYEFDAVRYFDFSRVESLSQARRAEAWFDSAPSYEPSPFVAGLAQRLEMQTANAPLKYKKISGNLNFASSGLGNRDDEISAARKSHLRTHHMAGNGYMKHKSKSSMRPTSSRTTTLMKPTASLLAKQNRPFLAGYNRSLPSENPDKSFAATCVIENQAAKRQKLESGLLRKVEGAAQMQQTNFVHKAPKRDGLPDRITHTKSRITVPKGPALETACRAEKIRSNNSKEAENGTSAVRRFKALPLNRKILEAPSLLPKKTTPRIPEFQEFHFKTSERAMQHSLAAAKFPSNHGKNDLHKFTSGSSTTDCGSPKHAWPNLLNYSRPDECLTSHNLKVLSVNKKILVSKEDKGNFRSSKMETDFNFQTEKKHPHNPPTELFNKLSLASDSQVRKCEPKLPWSISAQTKGSKENLRCFQQVNEPQLARPANTKPSLCATNWQF